MKTSSRLWHITKAVTETAALIAALAIWLPVWAIMLFFWEITHI